MSFLSYLPDWLKLLFKLPRHSVVAAWERFLGRKVVVFHIELAGQAAYISSIVRNLQSRKNAPSIYLVVGNRIRINHSVAAAIVGVSKQKVLSWNHLGILRMIDVFVTPTQWICDPPGARHRICIFHGQPTKGITFLPELISNFTTLFLLGPLQHRLYEEFSKTYSSIAHNIKTYNIGFPKSDALIKGDYSKKQVLSTLTLDATMPVILYAPTWDKGSALDMYGELVIEKLLDSNANILVKLHYMSYESMSIPDEPTWHERLRKFEGNRRFRHLGNQPIDPYLVASDVLVTDISSASFEFMILDKPVVFIDCPDFFNNTLGSARYVRRGDDVLNDIRANAGRSAGLVVPEPAYLPDAIKRSLQNPGEFSALRRAVRDQLLYNPGRATEAAAEALLDLIR